MENDIVIPIDYNKLDGIDERFIIKLWRLCKKEYKYIVGFILGCIITIFVMK
jgi:hypothetical protein